jgi:uncharacterized membrane protein
MAPADGPVFNDWRFVALSPLPGWALALLGAAVLVAVFLAWRGMSAEGRSRRRFILVGLRVVAALIGIGLLLEPGVELLATTKLRGRVAVLVDQSKSMLLPAQADGTTRAAAAEAVVNDVSARADLESRFQVEYYGFGDGLWPIDAASLKKGLGKSEVQPATMARETERTLILPALEEAAKAGGSRPLAGVVLLSDGADNGTLDDTLRQNDATRVKELKGRLKGLGAPVFALDVTGGDLKDVAVSNLKVDDFAFVRNTVEVEVEVSQRGYAQLSMPVVLEREGQVVATAQITSSDEKPGTVKLSFIPDTTGEFAFTVRVPVQPGEAVTANNTRSFVLKVIRDRVRVLHVAGRPSYDERFLRALLKRDPNVDLVSFFILRTPTDLAAASNDELSLIPFPTDEIFNLQLKTFDLIIFHNFTYRPYRMSQYLPGIASYVRDGGAFMMIGGENSYSEGAYKGTAIEEILPVQLDDSPQPPGEEVFAPRLTAEGRRHPVTELAPGEALNVAAWQALPNLMGLNHTTLRPDAHALLEHPTLTDNSGRPMPVIAVADIGRGRSMSITTDETWEWNFLTARDGRSQRSYDSFFHNAIRWLVRDPELTQVRVQAEKERFAPSESVAFIVKARSRDYGPAAGARVELQVRNTQTGDVVNQSEGVVGQDGTLRLDVGSLPAGPYRAQVVARNQGQELGRAEDVLVVEESGPELSRPTPRPDLLKFVADATGGLVLAASKAKLSDLPIKDPERIEIGQRKSRPIWDKFPLLALLCLVLGSEWFLRRRWGFF